MVREKAASEAESVPSAAGVRMFVDDGSEKLGEVSVASSLRIDVLCLRAELNCVFCLQGSGRVSMLVGFLCSFVPFFFFFFSSEGIAERDLPWSLRLGWHTENIVTAQY